jgi:flagellar FliJ protein
LTNNRIQRLQHAAQIARDRETSLAQGLADCQRRLAEHQARLQQLLTFRGEYSEQLQNAGRNGISAYQVQNYVAFLANLDHGIAYSQQQLKNLREEFQRQRNSWMISHAKAEGLAVVMQRYRLEQGRITDRREQSENDERALQRYRQVNGD